jgi:hypothetical protein
MSSDEKLQQLIQDEAERAEATMNDPIPAEALARATRPGHAKQGTVERTLDEHHPAEPDRDQLAAQLDRARRGIAGKE